MNENNLKKCTEKFSIEDFRQTIIVPNWQYLENHGWAVNTCGAAQNENFIIDTRGILKYLDGSQFEQSFDEWLNDTELKENYLKNYSQLTKYIL